MSIKAMKQALEALEVRCGTHADERKPGGVIEALRTAIQQAESEPVLFVSPEQARAVTGKNRVHYTPSDNSGRYLPVRATPAGLFVQPLYTHPAPGVPDDVVRDAIATVREQYRGTDWGKAAECICDAIDAAMLEAKDSK